MTLTDFTKRMKKLGGTPKAKSLGRRKAKPVEIIDDVVDIGKVGTGWDRVERNGRMYLTRRD